MSGDWIHTMRGVRLVEGTLPWIARGLEGLQKALARPDDWDVEISKEKPSGGGWEPFGVTADGTIAWRKPAEKEKA